MAISSRVKSYFEIIFGTKGDKEAVASTRRVQSATSKLTDTIKSYALTYFGARGMYSALKSVVALHAEQERAEKRLLATTKRLGFATDDFAKSLYEQASALQKVSTFGDETIISVQRLLLDLGATEQNIKPATKATLELASALGMDLNSAARLMGQALSGNVQTLSRYIPEVRNLTEAQIKNGETIDLIIEKLGGSSEAEVDTLYGALAQSRNLAGDLGEKFGAAGGAARYLADGLRNLLQAANNFADSRSLQTMSALIAEAGGWAEFIWALSIFGEGLPTRGAGFQEPAMPGETGGSRVQEALERRRRGAGTGLKKRGKARAGKAAAAPTAEGDIDALLGPMAPVLSAQYESSAAIYERMTAKYLEEVERRAEAERRFAQDLNMNMMNSMSSAISSINNSFLQFFTDIVGANSKAANKMAKAMLFMEGAMAVTRGIVALQHALSTIVQTEGVSAIQIPPAIGLIASGTMMMAGQFVKSAKGTGGAAGSAYIPSFGGAGGGADRSINVTVYYSGLDSGDLGAQGEQIAQRIERAQQEGRIP